MCTELVLGCSNAPNSGTRELEVLGDRVQLCLRPHVTPYEHCIQHVSCMSTKSVNLTKVLDKLMVSAETVKSVPLQANVCSCRVFSGAVILKILALIICL